MPQVSFSIFFSSRTNLKLHIISLTPTMVKKVIANLDSSKASGPNCIPVEVLMNWEPELSYILAGRSTAKNYRPVSLVSVVSKVFEKLIKERIADHIEKCAFFRFPVWF